MGKYILLAAAIGVSFFTVGFELGSNLAMDHSGQRLKISEPSGCYMLADELEAGRLVWHCPGVSK